MDRIYLDYAATTPTDRRVLKKMIPYFSETFGNPNSLHTYGRKAVCAVDDARDKIAALLGASSNEIYFTSGGTEADNWAIRGVARACSGRGRHVIVGAAEHHAVLESARELQDSGFEVTFAPVNEYGAVTPDSLRKIVRSDTVLVAVMAANNELGTVQPLGELCEIAHGCGALFFTDAVQAAGSLALSVNTPKVDLLSISSHKFYGPKGAGALYIRSGTPVAKLIAGGLQERGLRGGTTNVPAVVGMAEAFALANEERAERMRHISEVRGTFVQTVCGGVSGVRMSGDPVRFLPGTVHFTFDGVSGEALLTALDLSGVAASGGAACSSGSAEPSHVLLAAGRTPQEALGGVRFSFGKDTSSAEAESAARTVIDCVRRLRALS